MNLKKLIFISVLFCALFTILPALPNELLEQPLQQDPAILSGQLPNGFTYYIQHNPNPSHLAELRLYVDVGSVVNDDQVV
jgi:zinc protease